MVCESRSRESNRHSESLGLGSALRSMAIHIGCALVVAIAGVVVLVFALPGEKMAFSAESAFFVRVIDAQTQRGVPLVELRTIDQVSFISDSQGIIAIREPEWENREIFVTVSSPGYEFPPDGFGYAGLQLKIVPGGSQTIALRRTQVAERWCRLTGEGIFRDSQLLGLPVPEGTTDFRGDVVGCDSIQTVRFGDKRYWFWGDTSRPHYPLGGSFHMTGAVSEDRVFPKGTAPESIDSLDWEWKYLVDRSGAVRPLAKMPGEGPTWVSALVVVTENATSEPSPSSAAGSRAKRGERLLGSYVKIKPPLEPYRWGFVEWDDARKEFVERARFETKPTLFLDPQTHALPVTDSEGTDWIYFCNPFPWTRVQATAEAFLAPESYESFTCLKSDGTGGQWTLARNVAGELDYAWRRGVPRWNIEECKVALQGGELRHEEARQVLSEPGSGRWIHPHSGSVAWNEYRQAWIMLFVELGGKASLLGEVWLAEADMLEGPWRVLGQVATHPDYSFYNPLHHAWLDRVQGRYVHFEGTLSHTFSGNRHPVPRYDYNQLLYRVDMTRFPKR